MGAPEKKVVAEKNHIEIHLNEVVVTFTNGKQMKTKSTYNKKKELVLDVDPFNHPAWQKKGGQFVNVKADRVAKFNSKFGNMDFLSASNKKTEPSEAAQN